MRKCLLILILLLIVLLSAYSDGESSQVEYKDSMEFSLLWVLNNGNEQSTLKFLTLEGLDFDNQENTTPIKDIGTVTSESDAYGVCRILFSTNKGGLHNLYIGATPFKTTLEDSTSIYSGYHLRVDRMKTNANNQEVSDWYDQIRIDDNPNDDYYIYIPVNVEYGSGIVTNSFIVSAIISSLDLMVAGQHVSTISLMRVAQ